MSSEDEIRTFLSRNPTFLEDWLLNHADPTWLHRISKRSSAVSTRGNEQDQDSDSGDEISDDSDAKKVKAAGIVPRTARKSITSDLFQQWLTATPRHLGGWENKLSGSSERLFTSPRNSSRRRQQLELLDQNDRLMDLILDISNELDINILCHKMLVNVGILTQADRCSLFLARGPRDARYLEAKLFDVQVETNLEEALQTGDSEEIIIPFGVGICGHVAQTKETINLKDAYEDDRFNREVDLRTGYRTHSLVCMPVCNYDGEVIGVAQIINKRGPSKQFTEADLKVFERYLTFCGIGIQNAQLFEVSILEYKKNQLLLSLARSLFQEQRSLEGLVSTIIAEAKDLLKCERSTVWLLELNMYDAMSDTHHFFGPSSGSRSPSSLANMSTSGAGIGSAEVFFPEQENDAASLVMSIEEAEASIHFQQAWEMSENSLEIRTITQKDEEISKSRRARIAKYVAARKEVLNLSSVLSWLGETCVKESDGFIPKNMLCVPIYNGQNDVIGVAQLINKKQGKFDESDINLFEAFAIFCGIGIHNTKMYESALKLMAKQKVALDCLSYHASASDKDTEELAKSVIPSNETFNLFSYKFNDTDFQDKDTYRIVIRMFLEFNLVQQFQIPYKVLCRWILSVKKNYRPVKYHNWRHALNVCQTMFTVLKTGKMENFMGTLEIFGLLVACLCHDLDHRGTNNAFQTKVESPLAILYSTSTMEHHHFDQCVMILSSEGNNIFQGLNTDDYCKVMKVVEQAILSTDLALYFRKKDLFLETANKGEIYWQETQKKDLLCGMLMTASDVSAIAKPWELQHRLAKRVADEFFDQGDMEKLQLNQQPIAMMDRERKDELPQMQVEFIDVVCRPLYSTLSESFPWIKPLLDGCLANREKWADLAEKVEMGLTWIDHETIDKPIEELALGTAEANDIEFKVETLKCNAAGQTVLPPHNKALVAKKRSFRTAKSPHRNTYNRSTGFFHRRLSGKAPSNRDSSTEGSTNSSTLGDPASSNGHLPRSSSQPNTEETPRAVTVDPPCRRRLTRKGQSQSVDDPSTPEIVVSEDDGMVAPVPPEGSQSQEDVSCQEVKSTRRSFRKTKSKVCNVL